MTHPLGVDGVRELAVVERSGLIESRHLGAAIVVAPGDETVRTIGDVGALIYPRSTLKPLQAIAVLRSGVSLDGERLVLASASHAGTPNHIRVVREILSAADLDESALQCPADWPLDRATRDALMIAGGTPTPIYMNCSGKHAAFLLACVRNGWPTDNYLDESHPLQKLIRATIEEFTSEPVKHSGVDGCGAPVHAVTLAGLARAISRVVSSADPDAARLTAAILANGWAIDGPSRPNTVVIEELRVVAKGGAEGVMVLGAPSGHAVALKILDGNLRAATLVALELLVAAGAIDRAGADRVIAMTTERVLGGGQPVGELRVTA